MAMAVLLARWGRPLACIVDHGLRAGSAAEAARTAARLDGLGIPWRIMRAELAPGPAAAERARGARYRLLARACREAGCADLAVAHHADDQAETVRMRAEAGSGTRGLGGMAALSYMDSARLLRPLLPVPPARLRATLQHAGLDWEEDPTNRDLRTLRARLRASADPASTAAALHEAALHGAARRQEEAALAEQLAEVAVHAEGYAIAPTPLSPQALSALIWTLSGQAYPPRWAQVEAGVGSRTLHGVLVQPAGRLGPGWLLAREPQAVAGPAPARAGLRWDGRFRLESEPGPGLTLGALGDDAAGFRRRSALPSVVLRTLPTLRRGKEVVAVPHLAFPDTASCLSVGIWFSPARSLAGAPFVPASVNLGERPGVHNG
jgi:tRNA(Ile)-lysidine synthase